MRKVLFGVTGIGLGHVNRQLALIDYFVEYGDQVLLFAYDSSYMYLSEKFAGHPQVQIAQVAVPFYVGSSSGISFKDVPVHPLNQDIDFLKINCDAMALADKYLGRPDVAISDYEPESAQYAYYWDAPLVTVDQQSKYLFGAFPDELGGFGFKDEIFRLRKFFPTATKRFACSFFTVHKGSSKYEVDIVPPILKNELLNAGQVELAKGVEILVYLSPAKPTKQALNEIVQVFRRFPSVLFRVFSENEEGIDDCPPNVLIRIIGDPSFHNTLLRSNGVITTAGHSLLSECMFLGKPVYAIPTEPYEQWLNAMVINDNRFGFADTRVEYDSVQFFVDRLQRFTHNILRDTNVLLRGNGQDRIIQYLETILK